MASRLITGAAAGVVLAAAAACAPVEGGDASAGAGGGQAGRTLTVFAAASLTETFEELGGRFEREHPATRVEFNFAGSFELANQIAEGAPADVFASADTRTMETVADDGATAGDPVVFVRNTLQIAVPQDNPAGVESLSDLADSGVKVALCAEEVPCGAAAAEVLEAADLELTPVSRERDVKAALTKAELGEVDAALVYRTDVRASGSVEGIALAEAEQAANDYPIAVLDDAARPGLAREWTQFVRSDGAAGVFDDAGFTTA
ncbi:molybdate ABC transporter substrate-binding protein [Streptomonospora wellingtoniae]|uniref:Molybdate ABC transporter substrate-binding protein n=1 Tax=Streptomonospora wellingtoniae TaxID=3075544 RepID=A0ABU2KVK2_9ACTN|nr:molybdate ABC transporter substrate-binding protein [Streptomonospora sp. DSM 45055]MDT0303202.1 molybdate ABC transporter substrate-binding protein [Streptomonospora sp. DSM 45055]